MLTVHVRVTDSSTGKPTPVRIRLSAEGEYQAPFGRLNNFATGPGQDVGGQVRLAGQAWAYIDGSCEAALPPGKILVEIYKGPEYEIFQRAVDLTAGQISLRLNLDRWTNWAERGWISGDVRAHELTPQAALLEGMAEGLGVVEVLARERPAQGDHPGAMPGLLAFSGSEPALPDERCLVAVNTLNEHPVLGTVGLLHSHRPVFPLRFGRPTPDDWSVADWCDQCHRKKGLVVWPELGREAGGEALAALMLEKVDAFEVCSFTDREPENLGLYYRLLDCGLRPTLVGASGKDSNAVALGSVRTYANVGTTALSLDGWIGAVRAGRTFVTNAPLISFEVNGQGAGSAVRVEAGQTVRVRAEAESALPFDQLEVLAGSDLVASKTASGNRLSAVLETEVRVTRSTWLAARCHGEERLATGSFVYAHTSPVWLDVPDQPMCPEASTLEALLARLDEVQRWIETEANCPTEKQRQHLLGVLSDARARWRGRPCP